MALLNNCNNREKWIEQIYQDFPDLRNDALKRHYVEQMVDAYIADEKKFKNMTQEMRKNGLDFKQEPIPNEILAIGRIEAEPGTSCVVFEENDDDLQPGDIDDGSDYSCSCCGGDDEQDL